MYEREPSEREKGAVDRRLRYDEDLTPDHIQFETVCPNNHNQTVAFDKEEFEAALKSDALVFHCNTCDTDWPPSSEEIDKIRKHFGEHSRRAQ